MQVDIHTQITNTIIKSIEKIQAQKQDHSFKKSVSNLWSADQATDFPANASTKNHYSGINVLVLWANAMEFGYQSHQYITFKQCKNLGGNVIKGEKGVKIVKLLTFSKENDEGETVQTGAALRAYTVFNVQQCENISIELPKPIQKGSLDSAFNQFIIDTGADIGYGGNSAHYVPLFDKVQMPQEIDFLETDYFKSTMLHELTHWTGHKDRLDRDLVKRFSTKHVAMEELIAELGSAFMCADWGVNNILQHAEYLDSWLSVLKSDNRAIFTAASKASQAAKFINEQVAKNQSTSQAA